MGPENLHIGLLQSEVHWEDPEKNLEMFGRKISSIDRPCDVVMLPEMFSTGFSMNVETLAEEMDGRTVNWMQSTSKSNNLSVCGSVIIRESGKCYNRFIWMNPDESFYYYDKKHLFRMADEQAYFSGGAHNITIEFKGWKIRPQVCYDLRFPVWNRNRYDYQNVTPNAEFDVLLFVANWPAVRVVAWDALLRARAIENQVYCIGLNRVGMDGTGKAYNGHSAAVGPKGNYLIEPLPENEYFKAVSLDYQELNEFREKFPQGMDADRFEMLP